MNKKKSGLSLFDLFSMGFGAIIGVGWSATLNNLLRNGGGPLPAILGFSAATILFIPIALCFAELAPAIPEAGGVIAYAKKAFNSKIAFIAGWFIAMAYISIVPWEAIAINDIVCYLIPSIREGEPLYTIMGENLYPGTIAMGIAMSFLVIIINWRGIEKGAKFQSFMILFMLAGSAICVFFTLIKADFSNLVTPAYAPMEGKNHFSFLTGALAMLGLAPSYYAGFDTIPQSVDSAKDVPKKSLGKIIIITLISAGLFYAMIFLSAGVSYPWLDIVEMDRPVLSNLLRTLYPGVLGEILWYICIIATLAGLFSTWNGFYIASGKALQGMAKAGALPAVFAKEHAKYKTPVVANTFVSVIMMLGPFLGAGVLDIMSILESAGFILGWGIACLAVIKLRKAHPEMERPYKIPGKLLFPILGVIISIIMFINCIVPGMPGYMGTAGVIAFVIWSLLGIIFYNVNKRKLQ